MPGKSTHSEQHLSKSRPPVLPASPDENRPDPYRRYPVKSPPDGYERQGQSRMPHSAPQAVFGRADEKSITAAPLPSLLAAELLRIEKVLEHHAADARQRADLSQLRTS
jgi:hypothetical protein